MSFPHIYLEIYFLIYIKSILAGSVLHIHVHTNIYLIEQKYLSLSLAGPEELCCVGPEVSVLPTEKPAPKLVI